MNVKSQIFSFKIMRQNFFKQYQAIKKSYIGEPTRETAEDRKTLKYSKYLCANLPLLCHALPVKRLLKQPHLSGEDMSFIIRLNAYSFFRIYIQRLP